VSDDPGGRNDFAERSADDHPHRQIDDRSFHRKLFKLFQHGNAFPFVFFRDLIECTRSPNPRATIFRAPKPKASGAGNRLKGKRLKRADQVRHVADNILIKLRTITTGQIYARESR